MLLLPFTFGIFSLVIPDKVISLLERPYKNAEKYLFNFPFKIPEFAELEAIYYIVVNFLFYVFLIIILTIFIQFIIYKKFHATILSWLGILFFWVFAQNAALNLWSNIKINNVINETKTISNQIKLDINNCNKVENHSTDYGIACSITFSNFPFDIKELNLQTIEVKFSSKEYRRFSINEYNAIISRRKNSETVERYDNSPENNLDFLIGNYPVDSIRINPNNTISCKTYYWAEHNVTPESIYLSGFSMMRDFAVKKANSKLKFGMNHALYQTDKLELYLLED